MFGLKWVVKFVFYPMLIVIVGMYYLISYLTFAVVTIVSGIAICKSYKKSNIK